MKPTFTLFLLFLFSIVAVSQDWVLINENRIYNYTHSDSAIITTSIRIDSVKIQNNDTWFYFNTIVTPCDTCSDPGYYLAYQPDFLDYRCIRLSDSAYWFTGITSKVILPYSNIGDQWLFDTLNNITASCQDIRSEFNFGYNDSVKIISLSSGDSILLSKGFGILQFPDFVHGGYYRLSGIDNEDIGETVPGFYEIFDFEVGDVFQTKQHYGGQGYYHTLFIKYTILAKNVCSDTISYTVKRTGYDIAHQDFYYYTPIYIDDIIDVQFQISSNLYFDIYPMQAYRTSICELYNSDVYYPITFYPFVSFLKYKKDENNDFTKESGGLSSESQFIPGLYTLEDSLFIPIPENTYSFHFECKAGIGISNYSYTTLEWGENYKLLGYIKGGDTTGTVYSDSYLLGKEIIKQETTIKVFPNPASDIVCVEGLRSGDIVRLHSILGREIKVVPATEDQIQISLKELSSGLYFLQVRRGDQVQVFKVLKE